MDGWRDGWGVEQGKRVRGEETKRGARERKSESSTEHEIKV